MSDQVRQQALAARAAARVLAATSAAVRNQALEAIAAALEANRERILAANAEDLKAGEQDGLASPLLKRLDLSGNKFASTVEMVRGVCAQPDPLGQTQSATELDDRLRLYRVTVPIGVIGVIFESRPDALVQIASLCLKSGNAALLKGGHEATVTNQTLAEIMCQAAQGILPEGWMVLLPGREEVRALLGEEDLIDLIIPRGSNEFVQYIMHNTKIPVMGHADGICHVYVDANADLDKAVQIVVDAKTQYVAVCNAAETLLVHNKIAEEFLPLVVKIVVDAKNVELRGDERTLNVISQPSSEPDDEATAVSVSGTRVALEPPTAGPLSAAPTEAPQPNANGQIKPATKADWSTEYLDLVLAVKVVDNIDEAIEHINAYGSHHTDAIITEDREAAHTFLREVDSSSVIHNASTRFADGFKYGLGAEVGISTNRLHSRGPVGLEGLVIYKYILQGDGHIVDTYDGQQQRPLTHRPLDQHWPA